MPDACMWLGILPIDRRRTSPLDARPLSLTAQTSRHAITLGIADKYVLGYCMWRKGENWPYCSSLEAARNQVSLEVSLGRYLV